MKLTHHVLLGVKRKAKLLGCLAALTGAGLWGTRPVQAMPQGGVIAGGNGNISAAGNAMTIAQQTQNLFVNWDAFSIGKGEKVQFTGPQNFAALNRVVGHDESKIYGEINAANHGNIYLINPNGILIGDGAVINAGSFVASTKDVVDVPDFIASGKVNFQGDAQGNIINLGAVKADRIEMHGDTISLKAANVNTNFNAPRIMIDANTIHAGIRDGETTAAVDQKLGVTAEAFQLKDTMQDLRKAVDEDSWGHFMLNGDDLTVETWSDDAPNLSPGASIDGLGYTVANKNITDCQDGSGIFSYATGGSEKDQRVNIENFTFDHISVTSKPGTYTGTLVGYLDGDGIRIANVTVANGTVTGDNYVGGLIGYSDGLSSGNTFLNLHNVNTLVQGSIEERGGEYTGIGIGGIIGYESGWKNRNQAQNIFRNVSNSGHVIGREHVGGIAGHLAVADMDQVRNTGRIEQQTVGTLVHSRWGDYTQYADSRYVGGIAGSIGPTDEAAANVRISHAYNGGTLGIDTSQAGYYDSASYIGGIVGFLSGGDADNIQGAYNTVIDYAHNTGSITTGFEDAGGIVGFATGLGKENGGQASDMIIRHSFNDGELHVAHSGGIAGTFGGTIEQSYNNGPLGDYSGGLVSGTDNQLYNDVIIRDSYNTKNGTAHVGGIIGVDYTEGTTLLERVWNEADIPVTTNYSGGIIGDAQNCGSITMNQVYNFGNVYGESTIGDMIGYNQVNTDATITFNGCVNYGDISASDGDEVGGFIGGSTPDGGKNDVFINDSANFGNITGKSHVGGFIGYHQLRNGAEGEELFFHNSFNYGTVTSNDGVSAGGMIGYLDSEEAVPITNIPHFDSSGTGGERSVGIVYYKANNTGDWRKDYTEGYLGNFGAQTGIVAIPDKDSYANAQFLSWKESTTLDMQGKVGTETGSYPDGGYVWKMYETDKKDAFRKTMYHKPELTAFQTKVQTVKHSVESSGASDVSNALYDVTMPDGQIIQGVDWKRVTVLQNQFTRVNNRGDGSQKPAYTASDAESNGSVPNHLYGFYNSSQQGLNIFINPETMEPVNPPSPEDKPVKPETPEDPTKPVLPHREISRNDYLYSDDHSTGDGELHWYMHMPPLIYIKDKGVKVGDDQ